MSKAPSRRAAKRTRRLHRSRPAKRSGSPGEIIKIALRTPSKTFALDTSRFVENQPSLAHEAMRWSYALRSRRRWSDSSSDEAVQARAAAAFLDRFGIDADLLGTLANAGSVEVDIPWLKQEERGWELRILPWEFLIASATRALRADKPLTVMRHLRMPDGSPPVFLKEPRVLFVSSEPGPLRGYFKFETERELVQTFLGVTGSNWHTLDTPTEDQLRDKVRKIRPDIVHLAGFDTHLARSILLSLDERESVGELDNALGEGRRGPGELSDGYVLGDGIKPVRGQALGQILTVDGHRPKLVALNIGNSASRVAPLVVSKGVHAATGFQDNFDDDLAELFFSVLYSRLKHGLRLPHAFPSAWEKVREQSASSQGTGIALWSASPLLAESKATSARQSRLGQKLTRQEQEPVEPSAIKSTNVKDFITARIAVCEDINYSMLHNQRPLFRYFVLRCERPQTIRNVRIKVTFFSGMELAVYDRSLDIAPPFAELKREIHVPLTSTLTRSVHESIRTSLLIEVTWGDHVLYRDTKRVRLTPVDQWQDTDDDRKWLPSFVFPRDPAVMQLVDSAQRYMRVLRDDPNAGFDGYQSADVHHPKTLEQIDLQVQAIWSAIVYDQRLGYINPPPAYSRDLDSQRLRTPTMIVRDHAGTCIDLALYFAACLELVDIYPAIILLKDHAFPAYWRADAYHTNFKAAHPKDAEYVVRADATVTASANAQQEAWLLGRATYREIVDLVKANRLVPIETVRLTENCGFWEAIAAGRDNLKEQGDFDSMIDIVLAREKQVTPLPILGEQS